MYVSLLLQKNQPILTCLDYARHRLSQKEFEITGQSTWSIFCKFVSITNCKWISSNYLASFHPNPRRTDWDLGNSLKNIPNRKIFILAFGTAISCNTEDTMCLDRTFFSIHLRSILQHSTGIHADPTNLKCRGSDCKDRANESVYHAVIPNCCVGKTLFGL